MGDGGRLPGATEGVWDGAGRGRAVEGWVAGFELRRGLGSAAQLLTTRRRPVKCGGAISAPDGALTATAPPPPRLARLSTSAGAHKKNGRVPSTTAQTVLKKIDFSFTVLAPPPPPLLLTPCGLRSPDPIAVAA